MSIKTEIEQLSSRIQTAYDVCQAKGATIPETRDTYHLSSTIDSIPTGSSERWSLKDWWSFNTVTELDDSDFPEDLHRHWTATYPFQRQTALSSFKSNKIDYLPAGPFNCDTNLVILSCPNLSSVSGSTTWGSSTTGPLNLLSVNLGNITTNFPTFNYYNKITDYTCTGKVTGIVSLTASNGAGINTIKRLYFPNALSSSSLGMKFDELSGGTLSSLQTEVLDIGASHGNVYLANHIVRFGFQGFHKMRRIGYCGGSSYSGQGFDSVFRKGFNNSSMDFYPFGATKADVLAGIYPTPEIRDIKVTNTTKYIIGYSEQSSCFYGLTKLKRILFRNTLTGIDHRGEFDWTVYRDSRMPCPNLTMLVFDIESITSLYQMWASGSWLLDRTVFPNLYLYFSDTTYQYIQRYYPTNPLMSRIRKISDYPEVLEDFDVYAD